MKGTEKFKKISSRWYTYTMPDLKRIESAGNAHVKDLVRLREGKGPEGHLFIEGMNIVEEAIRSHHTVKNVLLTGAFIQKHGEYIDELNIPMGEVTIVSDAVAKKLSGTKTPQGIYAVVEYMLKNLKEMRPERSSVIPVLDRIQDPGNLGTIIRTADAFDYRKIILLEGTCSPFNQKAIRSSAGSIFHLQIALSTEEQLSTWAKKHALRLIIIDPGAKTFLHEVNPENSLLIFGNEASGISPFLKEHANERVCIETHGKAESLNVSIAAALVLYEAAGRT